MAAGFANELSLSLVHHGLVLFHVGQLMEFFLALVTCEVLLLQVDPLGVVVDALLVLALVFTKQAFEPESVTRRLATRTER